MRDRADWLAPLLLVGGALVLWAPGLATGSIVNGDDPFYAMVIRDIVEGRRDVHAALGWRMPLFYLAGVVSVNLFGLNELGLRLPSLVAGLACVVVTYGVGRRLWPQRRMVAFWGAALLLSLGQMFLFARRVRGIDLCVTAFGIGALWLALASGNRRGRWAAVGFLGALGFLTKSVVIGAMVPPVAVVWWMASEHWRGRLGTALASVGGAIAPLGLWAAWVLSKGTAGVTDHFGTHVVARATAGPLVGEQQGVSFYAETLLEMEGLIGALGLLACAGLAIWVARRWDGYRGAGLALCSVLGVFVPFSLAATKVPHYVLPAYPGLALGLMAVVLVPLQARVRAGVGHLVGAFLVAFALLASPIGILASWGQADWSPVLKAGALEAREVLPRDGRLWVLNEYHAAAAFYFDGATLTLTTEPDQAAVLGRTRGFSEGRTFEQVTWAELPARLAEAPPSCLVASDGRAPEGFAEAMAERFSTVVLEGGMLFCGD